MTYTVFFKEAKQIITADNFISQQPIAHQDVLKAVAGELARQGAATHPQATRNPKGDWSILLNDNGDTYIYTLFISKLEMHEANNEGEAATSLKRGTLVIIDPSGPRDTIGGYHPGYWFAEQFVNFLEENQRPLFTQTIYQINHNIPSENYSVNNDGSVSIHIQKKGKTSGISLTCRAEWV